MERTKDKYEKARFLIGDEASKSISDEELAFNFDLIESQVLSFCNRLDFPTGLMLIVIKMVAEYSQANYYKKKEIEKALKGKNRRVSSVSRGDTTISYGDDAKVTELGSPDALALSAESFVDNYKDRIIKYRKLRTL